MNTKQCAGRKPKAARFNLRKAVNQSAWLTCRNLAVHVGCHENTLNQACRENRLPRNAVIRAAVIRALAINGAA